MVLFWRPFAVCAMCAHFVCLCDVCVYAQWRGNEMVLFLGHASVTGSNCQNVLHNGNFPTCRLKCNWNAKFTTTLPCTSIQTWSMLDSVLISPLRWRMQCESEWMVCLMQNPTNPPLPSHFWLQWREWHTTKEDKLICISKKDKHDTQIIKI